MRKRITTINHFDILSVSHGGTHAILDFYYELSRWYDVNIVMLVNNDIYVDMFEYSNGVKIFPVYYNEKDSDKNQYDFIIDELPKNENVVNRIKDISSDSEIIISEHVYTWNLVKAVSAEKRRIYRALNVEYDYMRMIWKVCEGNSVLKRIFSVEEDACKSADLVFTIGENDRIRMIDLYKLNEFEQRKIITIGAGFSQDKEKLVWPSKRIGIQGCDNSAIYIASRTPATIEAVKTIIIVAKKEANVTFFVAGSVCSAFEQKELPRNVVLKGIISDDEKNNLLSKCDFAINPIEDGAGVNIKMLEYFSIGIPVITSAYGVRGIDAVNNKEVIISKKSDYGYNIEKFLELSSKKKDILAKNARKLFDEKYSWKSIALEAKMLLSQRMNFSDESDSIDLQCFFENNNGVFNISDEVYIRGAGIKGKECLGMLNNNRIRVKAFVDKNKEGKTFAGIPIINTGGMDKNTHIVIAISKFIDVLQELIELGVDKNDITIFIGRTFVSLKAEGDTCSKYIDLKKLNDIVK